MPEAPWLDRVDIVLVRPTRPANVASACRALKNMGLRRLTLVDPPEGLDAPDARALAYGGWDVLDGRRTCARLEEALTDSTFVVGTSGKEGDLELAPRDLPAEWVSRGGGSLSIVFGPEASGLRGDELGLCHARIRIPANPLHPSLNLAHAVLILAYELRTATGPVAPRATAPPAPAGELETALADLRRALLSIGYLNPDNPDALLGEIRGWLARTGPTSREVSLLRGMARQIRWAGERCTPTRGGG